MRDKSAAESSLESVLLRPLRQNMPNGVSEYAKQDKTCQMVFQNMPNRTKHAKWCFRICQTGQNMPNCFS